MPCVCAVTENKQTSPNEKSCVPLACEETRNAGSPLLANLMSAEILKWLHPMRSSRTLFAEKLNPWMLPLKMLAPLVAKARMQADDTNQFVAIETQASASISKALDNYRKTRDTASERLFSMLYGKL